MDMDLRERKAQLLKQDDDKKNLHYFSMSSLGDESSFVSLKNLKNDASQSRIKLAERNILGDNYQKNNRVLNIEETNRIADAYRNQVNK